MHSTTHIEKVCFPEVTDKHPQSGVCYVGYTVITTGCDGICEGKYERTKKIIVILNYYV